AVIDEQHETVEVDFVFVGARRFVVEDVVMQLGITADAGVVDPLGRFRQFFAAAFLDDFGGGLDLTGGFLNLPGGGFDLLRGGLYTLVGGFQLLLQRFDFTLLFLDD